MRSVPGPKKFQERFPSLCHYAVRLEMLLVNVNILHDIVSVKDTQPGRITTRVEAAATFSVYRNIHSGKTILLVVRGGKGEIAGVEYELWNSGVNRNNVFSEINNAGRPLLDNPAPCAVCYAEGRSAILMIPARTECPASWTAEYAGYLVSEARVEDRKRSSYVCWDEAPEVAVGGTAQNHAVMYPVEVLCGSVPCSLYPTGRELTCIVCSK